MPRPKESQPKHCKQKTRGGDRGYVVLSGERKYTGPVGSWGTQDAHDTYLRLVAEWITRGRRPEKDAPAPGAVDPITGAARTAGADLTVTRLVAAYWIWCKTDRYARWVTPGGKITGELSNIRQALKPLKDLYGPTRAAEFGCPELKAVRAHMIAKGNCRNYINRTVCRIVAVFGWAQSERMIDPMVHHGLTTLPPLQEGQAGVRESEPVGSVSDAMVDAVLDLLPGPVRAIVELQALTGARGDELRPLRTGQIDRSNPKLWEYRPRKHKTSHKKKKRFIPLNARCQKILAPYLKLDPEAYCFPPAVARGRKGRVNRPFYDQHAYRRCIARACELAFGMPKELRRKAPKPKVQTPEAMAEWADAEKARRAAASAWRKANVWTPHRLRHSVITRLRKLYGEEVASIFVGHSRVNATLLYGERNEARVREIAEATAEVG